MTHNPGNMNMADMRAKLRASQAQQRTAPAYDYRTAPQAQFSTPPNAEKITAIRDKRVEQSKGVFWHLHLHWHIYIAAFITVFFHLAAIFPNLIPEAGRTESLYAESNVVLLFIALNMPGIGIYFLLRKMRRGFQQAAKITEAKHWTGFEKGAAAIGFALMAYWTFFHAGGVNGFGIPLGDVSDSNFDKGIPLTVKDRFDLTFNQWVFSIVKCVGAAVAAVMFTRRFLAGEKLFGFGKS